MNDLENLMNERNSYIKRIQMQYNNSINVPIQKSDKSASLFDFIKMIDKLITLTMPNVRFIPDEGKILELDSMKEFSKPVITYKTIHRKPKGELKPRVRENFSDAKNEKVGQIFGQKFECLIQFNIFASVYTQAEEVMKDFEDLMNMYTGFFKKNGVAELIFDQQTTDDSYAKLRETLSVRNLIYYVEIEKLTVILREKIKEIEILAIENKEEK